jgi:hypothetical protein
MFGSIDTVVLPETTRAGFHQAAEPTRLVELGGSGHLNGFSDICMIGAEGGGIVKIAIDNGLPVPENLTKLGTDGCQSTATGQAISCTADGACKDYVGDPRWRKVRDVVDSYSKTEPKQVPL